MLHIINSQDDALSKIILDDPVRPEIALKDRIGPYSEILISMQDGVPAAAVCVKYCNTVPDTVESMLNDPGADTVAIFYTIWSYKPRAGAKLIFQARDHVMSTRPTVDKFVTLSPQTDMARRFHINNGAIVFRENINTVNYEYL